MKTIKLSPPLTKAEYEAVKSSLGADILVPISDATGTDAPFKLHTGTGVAVDLPSATSVSQQISGSGLPTYHTAASQAAMLVLAAKQGDWCLRSDLTEDKRFFLKAADATVLANWEQWTDDWDATKQALLDAKFTPVLASAAMSAGYPTATVARSFSSAGKTLSIAGISDTSFSGVDLNGTSIGDSLTGQYIANTLNTSAAGEVTCWFGVVESPFTKCVKAKFVNNGSNVDVTITETGHWNGDVLTDSGWTATGGVPASRQSTGTPASSNAAAGYGLESLAVAFSAVATSTQAGLMGAADKAKLEAAMAALDAKANVDTPILAYSATEATYAVGELRIQGGKIYRCTTAITAAEAFTASKWTMLASAPIAVTATFDANSATAQATTDTFVSNGSVATTNTPVPTATAWTVQTYRTGAWRIQVYTNDSGVWMRSQATDFATNVWQKVSNTIISKASTIHVGAANLAITEALHNNAEIHLEGAGNLTIAATAVTTDTFGFTVLSTGGNPTNTITPTGFAGVFLRSGGTTTDLGNASFTILENEAYRFTVTDNGGKWLNIVRMFETADKAYVDALSAANAQYLTYGDTDSATAAVVDSSPAVATPTLSAAANVVTGSAFSSALGETHAATKWETDGVMGAADAVNKTSLTVPATAFTAIDDTAAIRAAYRDSNGNQSQRSASVNATLKALSIASTWASTSYPTATVVKTFDHSTVALALGNFRADTVTAVVMGGQSVGSGNGTLASQVVTNSINTNTANEVTFWVAHFDGTYTKAVKVKLVVTSGNIDLTVTQSAFWTGNVLASTSWSPAGAIPTGSTASTIASSQASGAYGLHSITLNFLPVAAALVPTMTANTQTISGEQYIAFGSDDFGTTTDYTYFRAFDGSLTTDFATQGAIDPWHIGIQFASAKVVKGAYIRGRNSGSEGMTTWKLQGSNDGITYTDINTSVVHDVSGTAGALFVQLNNSTGYTHYRVLAAASVGANRGVSVLQFYA